MECKQLLVRVDADGVHVARDPQSVPYDGTINYQDPLGQRTLEMFRRWLDAKRFEPPANDDLALVGSHLYRVLFSHKPVRKVFQRALQEVVAQNTQDSALRVVLEFGSDAQSTRLAALPWEYLYCPPDEEEGIDKGFFIAAHAKLILSRHVSRTVLVDLAPKEDKLRILLLISRPAFEMVPAAAGEARQQRAMTRVVADDVIAVLTQIRDAMPERVELRIVEQDVSKSAVTALVEDYMPQVVHFIGHGKFEHDAGYLALVRQEYSEDAENLRTPPKGAEASWVKDDAFADCFANYRPRLVFLQACEGARSDAHQAFSGVALKLVRQSVAAVIAMRFPVSNDWAQLFARTFYEALAAGRDIDQAVQLGRLKLGTMTDEELNFRTPDFGSPVAFFQRQQDGQERRPSTDAILPALDGALPPAPTPPADLFCPYAGCERPVRPGVKFCQACRRPIAPCPSCRKLYGVQNGFCDNCGWTADKETPAGQASPARAPAVPGSVG